ncbi:MAG: HDOD domain-containing protein [Sedimentisphaerales bacterium]|jgi:HD-like signal output (HDOD) protein
MESKKKLENQVAELVDRLPPMPKNIESLLRSGEDGQHDEELIALVAQDPGLCADLLHLANTLDSTPGTNIETVAEAVRSIGSMPLIQFVGVWYARKVILKEFSLLEHLDEYFLHSQEISFGCRILSEVSGVKPHGREVLSVAGLIHDIGRLVIMLATDKTAADLMGTPWDKMTSIAHDERDFLGMDHCIVGEQICRKWNFSPYMQEGVLRHHSPLIGDDFSYLGGMIFMTHFVTNSDFTGEMLCHMLPDELIGRLGLDSHGFANAREAYFSQKNKMSQ